MPCAKTLFLMLLRQICASRAFTSLSLVARNLLWQNLYAVRRVYAELDVVTMRRTAGHRFSEVRDDEGKSYR